jgi:aryl-alcohol dehydrogenase-like predicted oxidoreductase
VSIAGASGRSAREFYARSQLPVLAWSPLGQGFFGGREGGGDRTYRTDANLARRERAAQLADQRGVHVDQIALAYLFSQPFPVSAVVATRSAERMKRNLEATELRLSTEDLHFLEGG